MHRRTPPPPLPPACTRTRTRTHIFVHFTALSCTNRAPTQPPTQTKKPPPLTRTGATPALWPYQDKFARQRELEEKKRRERQQASGGAVDALPLSTQPYRPALPDAEGLQCDRIPNVYAHGMRSTLAHACIELAHRARSASPGRYGHAQRWAACDHRERAAPRKRRGQAPCEWPAAAVRAYLRAPSLCAWCGAGADWPTVLTPGQLHSESDAVL